MDIKFIKDTAGNSYEIVVWKGLYSGKNYKLCVSRDCFNEITIYFYEYNPEENDSDCVEGGGFESFRIIDLQNATLLAEAIIELSSIKYKLNEPE